MEIRWRYTSETVNGNLVVTEIREEVERDIDTQNTYVVRRDSKVIDGPARLIELNANEVKAQDGLQNVRARIRRLKDALGIP